MRYSISHSPEEKGTVLINGEERPYTHPEAWNLTFKFESREERQAFLHWVKNEKTPSRRTEG